MQVITDPGVSVGFGRGGTSSNSGGTSNLRQGVWGPLKAPSGAKPPRKLMEFQYLEVLILV